MTLEVWQSNAGYIDGRQVLSQLRHPSNKTSAVIQQKIGLCGVVFSLKMKIWFFSTASSI